MTDLAPANADTRALEALSPFRVDGKVACVTGGGSGIGRAIAELLSSVGAAVVVGDLDFSSAEVTANAINRTDGQAVPHAVDVGKRTQVEALVEHAVDSFGRLDFMCNIAGIPAGDPCPLSELKRRLDTPARRQYRKLTSETVFNEIHTAGGFHGSFLPKPRLSIDTSLCTPLQAAAKIAEVLSLDLSLT